MTKIKDANAIRTMIENGVRTCPLDVDEDTFKVLLAAYAPANDVAPEGQTNALVPVQAHTTAVAMPADGQAFGLDDFEASGSAVDGWISVSTGVYKIKGDPIQMPADGIKCVLHGEATKFAKGIRCTLPNGDYKYFKTYNGSRTVDGDNWADVVLKCTNADPNSYVYDIIEMELTVEENVMDVTGKKITVEAGTRIGMGTSPTGAKFIRAFNNELKKEGLTICSPDVPARVKGLLVERKKGNPYQIVTIDKR